ncbi:unnamed protein product [Closterium sp. Naga37s-1]|nr:unnamed protein product [Closterium sp. Naga37s-1]
MNALPCLCTASPSDAPRACTIRPLCPSVPLTIAPRSTPLAPRPSLLAPRSSPLAPRPSLLAPRSTPLAPRPSPLAPRPSLLAPRSSPLAPRPSPLAPRSSPLAPRPSPLAPRSSPLTPRPSLLAPRPTALCESFQSSLCPSPPLIQSPPLCGSAPPCPVRLTPHLLQNAGKSACAVPSAFSDPCALSAPLSFSPLHSSPFPLSSASLLSSHSPKPYTPLNSQGCRAEHETGSQPHHWRMGGARRRVSTYPLLSYLLLSLCTTLCSLIISPLEDVRRITKQGLNVTIRLVPVALLYLLLRSLPLFPSRLLSFLFPKS